MMKFCARLEELSERLYVQSSTITEEQYDIHDENQIYDTPIFSRSCQLRRVDNNKREIVLAVPLFQNEYPYSKDTIFILSCLDRDCMMETTAIIFDLEDKYPDQHTGM